MKKITTIYLADDHQLIIDGLKLLINTEAEYEIIGSSNDGDTSYNDIIRLNPDIAILDLRMPARSGVQLVIGLKNKVKTKFIVLSMYDEKRHVLEAKNIGAYGYLLKNSDKAELLECIDAVSKDIKYFKVLDNYIQANNITLLGNREIEILKLVLDGHSTKEIAEKLNRSPFTIETHRKSIYRKTGAKNLVSLLKFAIENEYLKSEE